MALLYNEGCPNSEEDITKCNVLVCIIRGDKFRTQHCDPAFESLILYYPSNDISNNLAKNIFTFEHSITSNSPQSKVTLLSNNDGEIVFLYQMYPYEHNYSSETYLCRFRDIDQ
ncbi:fam-e protein, partial [Plasmodium gallinaceum]